MNSVAATLAGASRSLPLRTRTNTLAPGAGRLCIRLPAVGSLGQVAVVLAAVHGSSRLPIRSAADTVLSAVWSFPPILLERLPYGHESACG
jgi:hypothetical protein